ncbi:hypothetical protein D7322_01665 [Sphingobacterium puteale]|uniref:Uncharacterized protein n=2 Tax=Sphingobacterium puteale TaxID=2420510 RepID=A0A420W472_9SPHI|nr:hypothetical protein D7322_01665 [Sphingobacterium puteale]
MLLKPIAGACVSLFLLFSCKTRATSTHIEVTGAPERQGLTEKQYIKVVGDQAYIGAKFDKTQDITILFRKCMFNDLMTFFQIGLANNSSALPSKTPERKPDQILNLTTSDNIGPVLIQGGSWIGGNHSYQETGKSKTAKTLSYAFYADGELLKAGDERWAQVVTVRVKNALYDPLRPGPQSDGEQTSLDHTLILEDVIYTILGGSIQVELSHKYQSNEKRIVERYYGMQSMFVGETDLMTPNGPFSDFQRIPEDTTFSKRAGQDFNRIIELNSVTGICQSTFLYPEPKRFLGKDNKAFIRAYGKSYHNLLASKEIKKGEFFSWSGLYTWFRPLTNNHNYLAYCGKMEGEQLIFIDCKCPFQGEIVLPNSLLNKKYRILFLDQGIGIQKSKQGLKMKAKRNGSLILAYK